MKNRIWFFFTDREAENFKITVWSMCLAEVHSPEIGHPEVHTWQTGQRAEGSKLDITRLMECLPGIREARASVC